MISLWQSFSLAPKEKDITILTQKISFTATNSIGVRVRETSYNMQNFKKKVHILSQLHLLKVGTMSLCSFGQHEQQNQPWLEQLIFLIHTESKKKKQYYRIFNDRTQNAHNTFTFGSAVTRYKTNATFNHFGSHYFHKINSDSRSMQKIILKH